MDKKDTKKYNEFISKEIKELQKNIENSNDSMWESIDMKELVQGFINELLTAAEIDHVDNKARIQTWETAFKIVQKATFWDRLYYLLTRKLIGLHKVIIDDKVENHD